MVTSEVLNPSPAREHDRAMRLAKVIEMTGMSRTQVYRLAREGVFPKPFKVSERISAWSEIEVAAWLQARFNARREL